MRQLDHITQQLQVLGDNVDPFRQFKKLFLDCAKAY